MGDHDSETPAKQHRSRSSSSGEYDLVSDRIDDLRAQMRDLTKELRAFMDHARAQESDTIRAIERCTAHGQLARDATALIALERKEREQQVIAIYNALNEYRDKLHVTTNAALTERDVRGIVKSCVPVDATRKSAKDIAFNWAGPASFIGGVFYAIYDLWNKAHP